MPKLIVEDGPDVEVSEGKRLVLAIEEDAGIDILHACGGQARCTTCRVEIIRGEPDQITEAENEKLETAGLQGVRLSCQLLCDRDMEIRVLMRLAGSGRADAGPRPSDDITPSPNWLTLDRE